MRTCAGSSAGSKPVWIRAVSSVASVFISRWDAAVIGRVPEQLRARLGLAVGLKTYQAYRRLMDSARWQRLANAGARVQRLLWASTSTKDPDSPDTMYIDGLRAPHTINTMPESTLRAFDDHGRVGEPIAADGGDAEATLAQFESAGVDVDALAATSSRRSPELRQVWDDLFRRIDNQVCGGRGVSALTQRRSWRAEQQMVASAIGLSVRGYKPFASTFAAFLTRAHDFIRMAAISQASVRLVGSHAGVEIGADGPSQMAARGSRDDARGARLRRSSTRATRSAPPRSST